MDRSLTRPHLASRNVRFPGDARLAAVALMASALAGCAAVGPPQSVRYRCEGGREFSVAYLPAGAGATIAIAGMQFRLDREPSTEAGERYGCSVLTLWRDARGARVDMQGEGVFAHCLPQF